jgi:hypothetical protein
VRSRSASEARIGGWRAGAAWSGGVVSAARVGGEGVGGDGVGGEAFAGGDVGSSIARGSYPARRPVNEGLRRGGAAEASVGSSSA